MYWDNFVLSFFIAIDFLLQLWIYWNSPKPLTSLEFHFFMYDWLDEFRESIKEMDKNVKFELIESRLKIADKIKRDLEELKEQLKNNSND